MNARLLPENKPEYPNGKSLQSYKNKDIRSNTTVSPTQSNQTNEANWTNCFPRIYFFRHI